MNFASFQIRSISLFTAALLIVCGWPGTARSQTSDVEIVDVQVGFGGLYKVGLWTPVTVKLKGAKLPVTGELRLVAPDGDDLPSRVTSAKPYLAAPGEITSAMLYIKFGRVESDLSVVFRDPKSGEVFAREYLDSLREPSEGGLRWGMFSSQELVVSVGASIGVEDAVRLQRRDSKETIEHVRLESVEQLPTRWYGYEGVRAVILSTSQPEIYRRLTETGERLSGLDEWVQRGGKLIITSGSQAGEFFKQGPLARFAPGNLEGITSLPQTAELEHYSEVAEPLPLPRSGESRLPIAQFSQVRGVIQAPDDASSDLPIVIRTPHGFGEVVFVTVDLDRAPFIDWTARKNFTSKLLGYPARGGDEQQDRAANGQVTGIGVSDLSGQLRGALDQFAGVKLVPFFVVASLVFVYILLIGPGDYFFVRNVLKKMEWTWVTFPLIVAAVSIGAYVLATVLKGKQLRLNQVDLVDVCLEESTPLVRGTSWMNVFSPRTDAYDMRFLPHPSGEDGSAEEVLFGWLGLPGSALGGMEERTRNVRRTDRPYDFSRDLTRLEDLPIHVWSTKSLTARWSMPDPGLLLTKDITLGDADVLNGEITSNLEVKLTDCFLAHDRWVYPIESLSPGETIDLGPRWKEREVLHSRLTGSRVEQDTLRQNQYVTVSSQYDQASFDVPLILRQMMFYEASGGQTYVKLLHRFQGFIDLSSHLDLNRCILIGFSDEQAGSLQRLQGEEWETIRGPEDRHWTCYRFVIPVAKKP